MRSFFTELRRRHVFKVAATYAVTGWVVAQVAEFLLDSFLAEALKNGLYALKGHRVVGGARASIYNAMPLAGVEALRDFMVKFQRANQ